MGKRTYNNTKRTYNPRYCIWLPAAIKEDLTSIINQYKHIRRSQIVSAALQLGLELIKKNEDILEQLPVLKRQRKTPKKGKKKTANHPTDDTKTSTVGNETPSTDVIFNNGANL